VADPVQREAKASAWDWGFVWVQWDGSQFWFARAAGTGLHPGLRPITPSACSPGVTFSICLNCRVFFTLNRYGRPFILCGRHPGTSKAQRARTPVLHWTGPGRGPQTRKGANNHDIVVKSVEPHKWLCILGESILFHVLFRPLLVESAAGQAAI
jgi:hypothetical protein